MGFTLKSVVKFGNDLGTVPHKICDRNLENDNEIKIMNNLKY